MAAELPSKSCAGCGRRIEWRAKWARCWDSVRWCGQRCRQRRLGEADRKLEEAIGKLLAERGRGKSLCPSEAARLVDPTGWRQLMERARSAARRLQARGELVVTQGGRPVDASTARGPIRLRRP